MPLEKRLWDDIAESDRDESWDSRHSEAARLMGSIARDSWLPELRCNQPLAVPHTNRTKFRRCTKTKAPDSESYCRLHADLQAGARKRGAIGAAVYRTMQHDSMSRAAALPVFERLEDRLASILPVDDVKQPRRGLFRGLLDALSFWR